MADRFLHGIELIEIEEGGRTVRTVKSSVIGLVGTAPDAAPARHGKRRLIMTQACPAIPSRTGRANALPQKSKVCAGSRLKFY